MHGYKISLIKIDPYFNVDAGTLSPYEHGEVYVLEDGGETDLDLGNYERLNHLTLSHAHNLTSGRVFQKTIDEERKGHYLGKTVQMIPHISNSIKHWIRDVSRRKILDELSDTLCTPEVCLIEIGGTVGDIESMIYYESIRQMVYEDTHDTFLVNMLTYVPDLHGELKTKPAQTGFKSLMAHGILPDFIFCRSPRPLTPELRGKIGMFCNTVSDKVYDLVDVAHTYEVYMVLKESGLIPKMCAKLQLPQSPSYDRLFEDLCIKVSKLTEEITIGIVGKYTANNDAYLSLQKAIEHSCHYHNLKPNIVLIDSEVLDEAAFAQLRQGGMRGVVIAGGYGSRGLDGKLLACKICREQDIPMLGICLGLQSMVIELCRSKLDEPLANSAEFYDDRSKCCILDMPEYKTDSMGGTMRLGMRMTILSKESRAQQVYQDYQIFERHRHRFEVNPDWISRLESIQGVKFSGKGDENKRMEIMEVSGLR